MKLVTSATSTQLVAHQNVEPITLIKAELGGAIGTLFFSDRPVTIDGQLWKGKIINIGHITGVKNQNSGSINSITVTLDDVELSLYRALSTTQLATKKVTVYEYFGGLGSSDLVTLLIGEFSTPLSWKEADRTLSFEVNTRTRSLQAGYTPLEGVQPDIIGKAMPLCFGTVFDVPATVLVRPRQAKLFDDVLFNDSSPYVVGTTQFRVDKNLDWADNEVITLIINTLKFTGYFVKNTFFVQQKKIEHLIYRGFDYNDPFRIYVDLTNVNAVGYNVSVMQRATFGGTQYFEQKYRVQAQTSIVNSLGVEQTVLILDHPISQVAVAVDKGLEPPDANSDVLVLPTLIYAILKAGTIVYQEGFTDTVYCFNSIPSTSLLEVQAYRSVGINSRTDHSLTGLNPNYYTSNLNYSFNGQNLSIVTLKQPLSYYNQGWDGDKIYCSLISSVGPNTADVIADIITRYTNLSVDLESFKTVHDYLLKYPSDFAVFSSKDALVFIGEICQQARCAYNIVNRTVFLRYLSVEPISQLALNDDYIVEASLEIGCTKVEDVLTQLVANYRLSYAEDEPIRTLLYNKNIDVFGLRRQVYEFYIYTNKDLVQKTLTFLGNRLTSQWKELYITCLLKSIVLDVLDCSSITYDDVTVKGIVDETEYDTLNHEVKLRFWLPVLAGESTQSSLAWLTDTADVAPPAPAPPLMNKYSVIIQEASNDNKNNNQSNQGNALLGIITGVNTDHTFVADIYQNGYDHTATETSVLVNLIDRRTRHKLGDKVLCLKIGPKYYDGSTIDDNTLLGKIVSANNDTREYTVDLYRWGYDDGIANGIGAENKGKLLNVLDDSISLAVDQQVVVLELVNERGNNEYWCVSSKSGVDLVVDGPNDSKVKNGKKETDTGLLSDLFTVKDGRLYLNVDAVGFIDNEGLTAELSDLLRIIGTEPCIYTDVKYTSDGVVKAPQELVLDIDKYRPATSFART